MFMSLKRIFLYFSVFLFAKNSKIQFFSMSIRIHRSNINRHEAATWNSQKHILTNGKWLSRNFIRMIFLLYIFTVRCQTHIMSGWWKFKGGSKSTKLDFISVFHAASFSLFMYIDPRVILLACEGKTESRFCERYFCLLSRNNRKFMNIWFVSILRVISISSCFDDFFHEKFNLRKSSLD